MTEHCFFFGCWNEPGHYLFLPNGRHALDDSAVYYGDRAHIDSTLAPRRNTLAEFGGLCWSGMGRTREQRSRIRSCSEEYPQGQFLLHHLDNGYTAIQWWDRCQGDERGACNSTVLLHGEHTAAEMIDALTTHFPHVLANLEKAGVTLTEVEKP